MNIVGPDSTPYLMSYGAPTRYFVQFLCDPAKAAVYLPPGGSKSASSEGRSGACGFPLGLSNFQEFANILPAELGGRKPGDVKKTRGRYLPQIYLGVRLPAGGSVGFLVL